MKQTFDYLEHVAFAATVCDKEGVMLDLPDDYPTFDRDKK